MDKLSTGLEDYLETVWIFEKKNGFSRIKEIADFLNVKLPTVNRAIKELSSKKLVVHERYGYIKLTDAGRKKAKDIFFIHNLLFDMFLNLGFSEEKSFRYACCLEHMIDEYDKKKIGLIMKKINLLKDKNVWK